MANLVFSLHIHTVVFAFVSIGWLFSAGALTGLAAGTLYMAVAFRRITSETMATIILKSIVVPFGYAIGLAAFYVGLVMGLATVAPGWVFGA